MSPENSVEVEPPLAVFGALVDVGHTRAQDLVDIDPIS